MVPPLSIIMTTWAPDNEVGYSRLDSGKEALESWGLRLRYDGRLHIIIADDDSTLPEYLGELGETAHDLLALYGGGFQAIDVLPAAPRGGVGRSLNRGFAAAFKTSPLAAYFVDDWALRVPLDLTPWATLLMRDESIGMVRLGPPHPGLQGTVEMVEEGWTLRLDATAGGFVFGHRPALYHRRFYEAYGWYTEGASAFEVERIFNEHFCRLWSDNHVRRLSGEPAPVLPGVVYALPHPWEHIGRAEVGDVTP